MDPISFEISHRMDELWAYNIYIYTYVYIYIYMWIYGSWMYHIYWQYIYPQNHRVTVTPTEGMLLFQALRASAVGAVGGVGGAVEDRRMATDGTWKSRGKKWHQLIGGFIMFHISLLEVIQMSWTLEVIILWKLVVSNIFPFHI